MNDRSDRAQTLFSLQDLEAQLVSIRDEVRAARSILAEARVPLELAEAEVKKCWARRKAALGSLESSKRAARSCGLDKTASAKLSSERFQRRVDEVGAEIKKIVHASREICKNFETAWALYLAAQNTETGLLAAIAEFQIRAWEGGPPGSRVEDGGLREPISSMTLEPIRGRQAKARAELRELQADRAKDEVLRLKELGLNDDGHYDPDYDEHELLLRRIRPWV